MNDASAEWALFASTLDSFLEKWATTSSVRALHLSGAAFDPEAWRQATALGLTSLLVPEEFGGASISGSGLVDLALVAEKAGSTLWSSPLHPVSVVLAGLMGDRNRERHAEVVDALMSGASVASWAVYRPGAGWSPQRPGVTAVKRGSSYVLDGSTDRVEAGVESTYFLVVVDYEGAVRQFLVPAAAPGVSVAPQASIDLTKSFAHVTFVGVEVPESATVGTPDQAAALVARQTQIASVLQCAEVIGILDSVMDMTLEWAGDRHSFGRPLASYQVLKHQFADLKIILEACRAATRAAVKAVSSGAPDAALAVGMAMSYVGENASSMIQRCIQLHGGIGVTWELDLHLFLRRTVLHRSLFGTPEQHNLEVFNSIDELEHSR